MKKKEKLKIFVSAVIWGIIIDITIELAELFIPTKLIVMVDYFDFWVLPMVLATCFASLAAIWWNDEEINFEESRE